MLSFYNPLERGFTRKQLISLTLYLIFFSASVWATAESISRTAHLPRIFCYVLSFAFLAGASFCLALIKHSLSSGYVRARTLLLSIGTVGFVFLWLISLTSNTHNFYFVATVEDLRRSELGDVLGKLRLLRQKTNLAAETAVTSLRKEIEAKIEKMKSEITNPGDPGHGVETEKILHEIEELLQREIQPLDRPPGGLAAWREYSNAMANQIRRILETRLAEVDQSIARVNEYLERPETSRLIDRLEKVLEDGITSVELEGLKNLLRTAFEAYNDSLDIVQQAFQLPVLAGSAPALIDLPDVPTSIRLENIASSWRDFLAGRYEPWRFWLSLLWAMALDLAAFILFYFGVLLREEDL